MFWANCEVIKPSIYAKAPVPVVVPKFKDRRPVYQAASEVMERCSVVAFDLTHINDLMLLVRDDLGTDRPRRGVVPLRERQGRQLLRPREGLHRLQGPPRLPALHLAQLARGDVGRGGELPDARRGARALPQALSGDEYQEAEYKVDKDAQGRRRRRQPRARQVLGDLGQGRAARALGRGGLRGHPRRGRPAPRSAELLPLPQAGLRHGAARLAGAGAGRDAVQATSSTRSTC